MGDRVRSRGGVDGVIMKKIKTSPYVLCYSSFLKYLQPHIMNSLKNIARLI